MPNAHPLTKRCIHFSLFFPGNKVVTSVVVAQIPLTSIFAIVVEQKGKLPQEYPILGDKSYKTDSSKNLTICGTFGDGEICFPVDCFKGSVTSYGRQFTLTEVQESVMFTWPRGSVDSGTDYRALMRGNEHGLTLYSGGLECLDTGMSSSSEFISGSVYQKRASITVNFASFKAQAYADDTTVRITLLKESADSLLPILKLSFLLPAGVSNIERNENMTSSHDINLEGSSPFTNLVCQVDILKKDATIANEFTLKAPISTSDPGETIVFQMDDKVTVQFDAVTGSSIPCFIWKRALQSQPMLLDGLFGSDVQTDTSSLMGVGCAIFVDQTEEQKPKIHEITEESFAVTINFKEIEVYGIVNLYFHADAEIAKAILRSENPLTLAMVVSTTGCSFVGSSTVAGDSSEVVVSLSLDSITSTSYPGASFIASLPIMRKGLDLAAASASFTIKKVFFSQGSGICNFQTEIRALIPSGDSSVTVGCVEKRVGLNPLDHWICDYEVTSNPPAPKITIEKSQPDVKSSDWMLRSFTAKVTGATAVTELLTFPRPATIYIQPKQFSVDLRSKDLAIYRKYYQQNKGTVPIKVYCERCDSIYVKYKGSGQSETTWKLTDKKDNYFDFVPQLSGSVILEPFCYDVMSSYCRIEDRRSESSHTYVAVYAAANGITDLRKGVDGNSQMQDGVLTQVVTGNVFEYWKEWTGKVSYIKLENHGLDIVYQVHPNESTTIRAFIGNQQVPFSPTKIGNWIETDGESTVTSTKENFVQALEILGLKQENVNSPYYLDYAYDRATGVIVVNNSLVKYQLKKFNDKPVELLIDVPNGQFKKSIQLRCSNAYTKEKDKRCVYGVSIKGTIWWIIMLIVIAAFSAVGAIIGGILGKYKPKMICVRDNDDKKEYCCECGRSNYRCESCECCRIPCCWCKCDPEPSEISGETKTSCCDCICDCGSNPLEQSNVFLDECACCGCKCQCCNREGCKCCCMERTFDMRNEERKLLVNGSRVNYYDSCRCGSRRCLCCAKVVEPPGGPSNGNTERREANGDNRRNSDEDAVQRTEEIGGQTH